MRLASLSPRARLLLAFAAVYIVWGSTYLGMAVAVQTIPPFLMAAARFLIVGPLMIGIARWQGEALPPAAQWRTGFLAGGIMLIGGNGLVSWAQQTVPTGIASLIVGTTPLWMVMLDWAFFQGPRPNRGVLLGLALGLVGIGVLVAPRAAGQPLAYDPWGLLALAAVPVCWVTGSLYGRRAPHSSHPLMNAGVQQLGGGIALLAASLALGEPARFNLAGVSLESALAVLYLIVFGSGIGFTSYMYLLQHTTPARTATYAYVNPVVAVFLGWLVLRETLHENTLIAGAIIVCAVALIVNASRHLRPRPVVEAVVAPSAREPVT